MQPDGGATAAYYPHRQYVIGLCHEWTPWGTNPRGAPSGTALPNRPRPPCWRCAVGHQRLRVRPPRTGIKTFTKLIEATGHQLTLTLTPAPPSRLGLPDTRLGRRLRHRLRGVTDIAARRGAHNVRVFGSVARGEDAQSSDVDLLVDLDDGVGLVQLAGLRRELTELLDVDVDVVPSAALKPRIRDEVLAEAITL